MKPLFYKHQVVFGLLVSSMAYKCGRLESLFGHFLRALEVERLIQQLLSVQDTDLSEGPIGGYLDLARVVLDFTLVWQEPLLRDVELGFVQIPSSQGLSAFLSNELS